MNRYNGEHRRLRPWGKELPIDVLGDNGFVIAPPSKLEKGSYEIIHGHFDDLASLKAMVGLEATQAIAPVPAKFAHMCAGDGRNRALWERCMKTGAGRSFDGILDIARTANKSFQEPLMDTEVVKIAKSAWEHDSAGFNFFMRPRVMVDHDIVDALITRNSDAMVLLVLLERYRGGNDKFILSRTMATSMGWGFPRWYAARDALVKAGVIRCISPGGRGSNDPPIYGWALKG